MSEYTLEMMFGKIESKDMYARLSSNTVISFIELSMNNDIISSLLNAVQSNKTSIQKVVERLIKLSAVKVDTELLHPYDHAIAVYLIILYKSNRDYFLEGREHLNTRNLPNLWWTNAVGAYFQKGILDTQIITTDQTFELPDSKPEEFNSENIIDSDPINKDTDISTTKKTFNSPGDSYA